MERSGEKKTRGRKRKKKRINRTVATSESPSSFVFGRRNARRVLPFEPVRTCNVSFRAEKSKGESWRKDFWEGKKTGGRTNKRVDRCRSRLACVVGRERRLRAIVNRLAFNVSTSNRSPYFSSAPLFRLIRRSPPGVNVATRRRGRLTRFGFERTSSREPRFVEIGFRRKSEEK